mgnify:CR=1 FL=1
MKSIAGKVALVTGGSQGLGKAIAETLAQNGASVVIGDIQDEQAKAVVSNLVKQNCTVQNCHLDVSNEEAVRETVEMISGKYGRLDILINNAGIDFTKPVSELTVSEWDKVIGVNLRGPFLLSKYALRLMSKQKKGHIVNIASTAAKRAWENACAYHASKWGLLGFSHSLFTEARHINVKVTALIAGGMRTPFILERFPEVDPAILQDPVNVAKTVLFVLTQPEETIIPEVMVLPLAEKSWP